MIWLVSMQTIYIVQRILTCISRGLDISTSIEFSSTCIRFIFYRHIINQNDQKKDCKCFPWIKHFEKKMSSSMRFLR